MSKDIIEFELHKSIGLVHLNRPSVHNAIDNKSMDTLEKILDEIESTPGIRVVIITGSGKESFCAGGDLKYFKTLKSEEDAFKMSKRMQAILSRFAADKFISIAAVNGRAYGGGCEILTACHLRIACDHATFSFRQAANGIITGWGGAVRLFRLLPHAAALRLLITSEIINAEEAHRIGFVNEVVPYSELMENSFNLAQVICENSPEAVHSFLLILNLLQQEGAEKAAGFEQLKFSQMWMGSEFQTWLKNFFNKSG